MRKLFCLPLVCFLFTLATNCIMAQQAHIISTRVLLDSCGYFPQLSPDGQWLLYSTTDASQLLLKNLSSGTTIEIADKGYPGFDAIFGNDGNIYYITQERKKHHLIYRTGMCYDMSIQRSKRVLKAQHGRVQALRGTSGTIIGGERRIYRSQPQVGAYVYTSGATLHIVDEQGIEKVLQPITNSNGYLWATLSPDGSRVLFEVASRGLCICDRKGNVLSELGPFLMPCWYNNDYIVAMSNAGNDRIKGSRIWLIKADGTSVQALTPDSERAIQPMVAAGSIIYTIQYQGTIKQLTLDIPAKETPVITTNQKGKSTEIGHLPPCHKVDHPRVFINPGHGGHDSDDRHLPTYVHGVDDTLHYYESNSNLTKGLALDAILQSKGYQTVMSRTTNTTNDDLDLFEIVSLAANSGADLFFAIHSNATGTAARVNFPLALYRGWDDVPTTLGSKEIATSVMHHAIENQTTVWTHPQSVRGDWNFFHNWGYRVGLGVLRYNKLPGMLSEGAFHDYRPERERLLNDDYCWLEAWCQSLGIDDYFEQKNHFPSGVIAGTVRLANYQRPDLGEQAFAADTLQAANGAMVRLLNQHGLVIDEYQVDNYDNGVYVFKHVLPGKYIIEASYRNETQRIEIKADKNKSAYHQFYMNTQQEQ